MPKTNRNRLKVSVRKFAKIRRKNTRHWAQLLNGNIETVLDIKGFLKTTVLYDSGATEYASQACYQAHAYDVTLRMYVT